MGNPFEFGPATEESRLPSSFTVSYTGMLLTRTHLITLHLGVRRSGAAVEVFGGIVRRQPEPRQVDSFLPVTLDPSTLAEARIVIPPPYTGSLRVRLDADGVTVHGSGELGINLRGFPFALLRFSGPVGVAR